MSEPKMFPNRNFITRKNKKLKNLRNLQENVTHDYVIILCNYSCSNLIGYSSRAFLDTFLIFQIFDRFVSIVKKISS